MQIPFLAVLLAAIFSFFAPPVQRAVRRIGPWIWAAPPLLTAFFAAATAVAGVHSLPLLAMVLLYTLAPVACAAWATRRTPGRHPGPPQALDFLAILLLWLPIEFGAGQTLIPRPAQGFLHSVAYGIAILLGLALFLGYRGFPGLKYNLPRAPRDFGLPLAGFILLAPVLIVLGIAIGFLPYPHLPLQTAGRMAAAAGIIFAGTAIPEEILFRALIQNLLMQRFGAGPRTLLAASVIFGCAHLDNGPQPLPNWRYAILATIAGWAYGKVFEKSTTVLSSAALHTLVDWTKHFFF
ncbi:MAG TPA: type II CAAX endopeptidase family protein [Bryobacteraceae bacterium]|nr:type II CAAX endopeptidase family protein [Bryobacteraceae bacterium]